ncbi:hypothetical protein JYT76_03710 [Olleya sp. AH-315-F22]|nr:hypothetical protein [Olleya sp. AH-315-F22]
MRNKNLKFNIIFLTLLCIGFHCIAQTSCETIQCDCENISEDDKKLGKEGLCKYLEKKLKIKCQKGRKNLKCQENAKGPNAWFPSTQINKIIKEKEKTNPSATTYNNVESILNAIKNSENSIDKYTELHASLSAMKSNHSGLGLAMGLSDLMLTINIPASKINFALSFASYPSEYSEASIDLFLPRLITGFSVIEELEIDQLDMKYDLGLIFKKLKANGYDLNEIFAENAHYGDSKVLSFVEDCDASVATNYSREQLRDLREVSSKIYLHKLNKLIPSVNNKKLSRPIKLISDNILEWNEDLIDISVEAIEFISTGIETRSWNQLKMKQFSLQYDKMYDDGLWDKQRYINSIKLVANELPIVWDLLKAIFLKK